MSLTSASQAAEPNDLRQGERIKSETTEHVEDSKGQEIPQSGGLFWTTKFMVFFAAWIGFAGWALQFDLGYTGLVLQMTSFNTAFGHCAPTPVPPGSISGRATSSTPPTPPTTVIVCELSATQQSVQSSIYLLFMAAGAMVAGIIGDRVGRRLTLLLGSLLIAIGAAAMLGTSGNLSAYIACKSIGAVGIGHLQNAAPTYGVECCPPRRRGLLVTLFSVGAGFGTFLVALVCYGSAKITSDWAWKVPIICQIPFAVILGSGVFIFPESPRWLMTKGNEAAARRSFSRFYSRSVDAPEVTAQIREIEAAIELEKSLSTTTTWIDIFRPPFLRRTLISTAIVVLAPLGGTFFIFTYAAIFLHTVGVSNPFTIVVILNSCSFAGSIMGPFVVEYLGRRRSILSGYATIAVCMLTFAVVSSATGETTDAVKKTVAAFLCLWAFAFSVFIASTLWIASAEMHSLRHRTYAQAFTTSMSILFVFATNFWTPYMIDPGYGNMSTNVGYFYFGWEVIAFVVLFCVVPETGRLSLEQIDNYFLAGEKPWKTSLAGNKNLARVTPVSKATN